MSKREAVGVMVLVTGLLLVTTAKTAPLGGVLVAGGAYLLALPHIAGGSETQQSARGRRQTE